MKAQIIKSTNINLSAMESSSCTMESPNASSGPPPTTNPITRLSTLIHHHCHRLTTDLAARFDATFPSPRSVRNPMQLISSAREFPFASVSQGKQSAATQSVDGVAKRLSGTAVYTVSNSSNEFVLMSDPDGVKSIGLLCFRQEDAEAFLSQVRSRKGGGIKGHARVVPITLDQVYMLKVEGIAFRFMPDPVQIKNALELKASDIRSGFDGVPVFQSDLLVVKKKNKRYCPIYFRKEDIEQELSTVLRSSRGPGVSQQIMVGSLEDVLKKMEINEKSAGWEDLIFIPPGKSRSQHIKEVAKA